MQKEAISVYDPSDPLEKAIQDAYHLYNDGWLASSGCQLVARSLANLKFLTEWLYKPELLQKRVNYFFAPHMSQNMSNSVFVTMPLFLRDIIENHVIDSYLHDPVTFVSVPVAHYLLTEYPVHIYIDTDKMKAANSKDSFFEVGGLIIASGNINLPSECIIDVKEKGYAVKVAATVQNDVFKIDEHKKNVVPNDRVWDKRFNNQATVSYVEAGEEGDIQVRLDNGQIVQLPKKDFDQRFVMASTQDTQIDNRLDKEIKRRLMESRSIQKIFALFNVDINKLGALNIVSAEMEDKYAETDAEVLRINDSILEDEDFFDKHFFIIAHEICHFVARNSMIGTALFDANPDDDDAYFEDEEEVLGFAISIAYEMERGTNLKEIKDNIFPKISFHFSDQGRAELFFNRLVNKAKEFIC